MFVTAKNISSKENVPRIGATRKRKEAQLLAFLIAYIYMSFLIAS